MSGVPTMAMIDRLANTWFARAKQALGVLHRQTELTLVVPLFSFLLFNTHIENNYIYLKVLINFIGIMDTP